jgi:hypothetical protein
MNTQNDLSSEIDLFLEHMPRNDSEELIILKGHLLLDQMLRSYISSKVKNPKYIDKTQIPFPSLIYIAWSFADLVEINYSKLGHCLGALIKFNALRNKLAHRLDTDITKDVSDFTDFVKQNLKIPFSSGVCKKYNPLSLAILVVYFSTASLLRFEIPKIIPSSYGELMRIAEKMMKR